MLLGPSFQHLWPAAGALLAEQSIKDPKFKGSHQAAVVAWRNLTK
jgi:hypothetical protein